MQYNTCYKNHPLNGKVCYMCYIHCVGIYITHPLECYDFLEWLLKGFHALNATLVTHITHPLECYDFLERCVILRGLDKLLQLLQNYSIYSSWSSSESSEAKYS